MPSVLSDCPFCGAKEAILVSCTVLDDLSSECAIGQDRRHTAHCMVCEKRFIVEEKRKIIPVSSKKPPNWLVRRFLKNKGSE